MLINKQLAGFTLVEMAMVLAIITLLLGGLLPTLSAQRDVRHIHETRKQLDEIQQSLIGFAIINDRLPCPAHLTGEEDPVGGGNCNHAYDGFVPAATLGLNTTDSNGFAVDPWGNRIHYAVASSNNAAFTSANGMRAAGLSALAPNLLVCTTATGASGSNCAAGAALTSSPGVPAVIYSTGKNGATGAPGPDEQANADGNRIFVSHSPTPDFDDQVVWVSGNILLNRMVMAGKLP